MLEEVPDAPLGRIRIHTGKLMSLCCFEDTVKIAELSIPCPSWFASAHPLLQPNLWPHACWIQLCRTSLQFPEQFALFPASVSLFMLLLPPRVSFPTCLPGDPLLTLPGLPFKCPLFQEAFLTSPGRIRASSSGHLLHFVHFLCDGHTLRWPPQWVTPFYNPLPVSVGRTSDLLLTNSIWKVIGWLGYLLWQRWWDGTPKITLHYRRLHLSRLERERLPC